MRCAAIYLVVKDFQKSIAFYEKILDMRVSATNGNRFAMFNQPGSLSLCLLNGYFDCKNKGLVKTTGQYWEEYDNLKSIAESENSRKVFINIGVEDLQAEYDRIKGLGIAEQLTDIRFFEFSFPYWYFTFMDLDGNPIEVTGNYQEK